MEDARDRESERGDEKGKKYKKPTATFSTVE